MKAVIMAGGEGSRLRPLTENTPKPLVRLCGRPVLEYLFDWLEQNSVTECVLALGHGAERIREYCAVHPRTLGVTFCEEPYPLGTAGCVRRALAGATESVLVLSGDALCDFPLDKIIRTHEKRGRFATIVTARTGDPREYGMVLTNEEDRVIGFVEKPAYSQVVCENVNTGIYVLSARAVERLPEQGDFAADFFPGLLREGIPLHVCSPKGYWCDIGGAEAYLGAQRDLLDGIILPALSPEAPAGPYTLCPPVWIGKNVRIGENAVIGPWTVLDDGCTVGMESKVSGSALLPGVRLGPRTVVRQSILCAGATVKTGASLSACALGEKAVIGRSARICSGARLSAGVRIPDGESVLDSETGAFSFDDEGISGRGASITPELAVRMGCAAGSVAAVPAIVNPVREGESRGVSRIGIAHGGNRNHRVLADALTAGIRSTGVSVMDFGDAFEAMFRFGMRSNALSFGVYIGGEPASIRLLSGSGLPAERTVERAVEQRLARGEFTRAPSDAFGNWIDLSGIGVLYATELLRLAPEGLEGMRVMVTSENQAVERMLSDTLRRLGCVEDEAGIHLCVSRDGTKLTMSQGGVKLGHHRTVAAYGRLLFQKEQDLAVENDFPRILDDYAQKWGRHVYRYLLCPADGSDQASRRLASRQCCRDALMVAVLVLADMRRREIPLAALDREIPAFTVRETDVALTVPPARVLTQLDGQKAGEGVVLRDSRGAVLVRAKKSGRSLRIFAEAASWETADELCADTIARVKKLMER